MAKAHQIFVGCPFLPAIRKNYDKLKRELETEMPIHVVLADTAAISSTDYLLEHITNLGLRGIQWVKSGGPRPEIPYNPSELARFGAARTCSASRIG